MDRSFDIEAHWRELCKQAMQEQDPQRLIEIVERLNAALDKSSQKPGGEGDDRNRDVA